MLWWLSLPVAVLVWATLIERNWFAIRREELRVLPKGSTDIIVLHISDIHLAPWQRRKIGWIKQLARKTKPDLVINTGDNLGHPKAVSKVLDALNNLSGVPGVYVNGSNDLYAPAIRNPIGYLFGTTKTVEPRHQEKLDIASLTEGFEGFGWLSLNNNSTTLRINGQQINFIGTDDFHENRHDFKTLKATAENLKTADLTIGVTHAPYREVLTELDSLGAEIIFAGHTHGGQVCLPFTGSALVTNCDLPTRYARGLHQTEKELVGVKTWLQVCAGVGTSIFAPVRLACRPEVRVLTLRAKD